MIDTQRSPVRKQARADLALTTTRAVKTAAPAGIISGRDHGHRAATELIRELQADPALAAQVRGVLLGEELLSLPAVVGQLTAVVGQLAEAQARTEASLGSLSLRVDTLTQRVDTLTQRVDTLAQRMDELAQIVGVVHGETGSLRQETAGLRREIGRLNKRFGATAEEEAADLLMDALEASPGRGWPTSTACASSAGPRRRLGPRAWASSATPVGRRRWSRSPCPPDPGLRRRDQHPRRLRAGDARAHRRPGLHHPRRGGGVGGWGPTADTCRPGTAP